MPGIENEVVVHSNDFIFGDSDGVLIIPEKLLFKTIDAAKKRALNEQKIRSTIDDSKTLDPISLNKKLGRW